MLEKYIWFPSHARTKMFLSIHEFWTPRVQLKLSISRYHHHHHQQSFWNRGREYTIARARVSFSLSDIRDVATRRATSIYKSKSPRPSPMLFYFLSVYLWFARYACVCVCVWALISRDSLIKYPSIVSAISGLLHTIAILGLLRTRRI